MSNVILMLNNSMTKEANYFGVMMIVYMSLLLFGIAWAIYGCVLNLKSKEVSKKIKKESIGAFAVCVSILLGFGTYAFCYADTYNNKIEFIRDINSKADNGYDINIRENKYVNLNNDSYRCTYSDLENYMIEVDEEEKEINLYAKTYNQVGHSW